jgi:hypothetical protein
MYIYIQIFEHYGLGEYVGIFEENRKTLSSFIGVSKRSKNFVDVKKKVRTKKNSQKKKYVLCSFCNFNYWSVVFKKKFAENFLGLINVYQIMSNFQPC